MKCAKLNALSVRAASETLMEDEDREEEVMDIIFAAGEAHDLKVAQAKAKAAAEAAAAKEAKRLEQRQAMIDRGEDPDANDNDDENDSGTPACAATIAIMGSGTKMKILMTDSRGP